MFVTNQRRCARLAAWTTAILRGRAPIDDGLDALIGPEESVSIIGLMDSAEAAPLVEALGQLRGSGVTGLLYSPALPGDVSRLPGPPSFNASAVATGGAVVAVDGVPLALLPSVSHNGSHRDSVIEIAWQVHHVAGFGVAPPDTVAEAERHLLTELNRTLDELGRLDVARWREEANDLVTGWDDEGSRDLPPGLPDRAQRLIVRSERMSGALALAISDEGGAVSNSEANNRRNALLRLQRVAAVAAVTAWNSGLAPTSPGTLEPR